MAETESRVTVAAEQWTVARHPAIPGAAYIVPERHNDVILDQHAVVYNAEGERYQRAMLMAAAPQLLEALETAYSIVQDYMAWRLAERDEDGASAASEVWCDLADAIRTGGGEVQP